MKDISCQRVPWFRPTSGDFWRYGERFRELIAPGARKITQDPQVYPNPTVFDPTRFLASETKKVQPNPEYTFGWGRR
jgi:cytochrome P450